MPRQFAKERAQASHILRTGSVEGVLPSHFRRIESGSVEVPNGVVSEELAASPSEHCRISLATNLFRFRVVLALVCRFNQNEWARGFQSILGQQWAKKGALVAINCIDRQPWLLAKGSRRGVFRSGVDCHEVVKILLVYRCRQFRD